MTPGEPEDNNHGADALLDAALAAELKPPAVPPNFLERLRRHIELERRRKRAARLPVLLDLTGYAGVAAAGVLALYRLVPVPMEFPPHASAIAAWVSASACVAAGLWALWFCRERAGYR